ncbi:MAG TPA: bifunctional phosphoribosyl-AMP cyclohydrolase/phosphoribosyl-ATP diphosphatase HisIE [Ohtaekwangia sp.]|nr:bifunctional phosphoribosyl-AMP cyclohydrolase/phosphoribosyl-ATP diphosphatase HisIE [Ohtaekwangia sp.]
MTKELNIDFSKLDGLVPCVVQDAQTKVVLMVGFMNQEAFEKTILEKRVTFYSRSKQRLWTKGETSGNFLEVVEIRPDCDNDTLLIKANPAGPVCHTGAHTCFNEDNNEWTLEALQQLILERKANPVAGSYTNKLIDSGINKVAQKVGEEAVELIIEAKDSNRDLFLGEAADLMYHYLVLLAAKDYTLSDVLKVLQSRHQKPA